MPVKVGVPSLGLPKKQRRRRSAASGAADDCHSCRARNAKCDRQRPYCQQCLDMGNDCSGYKQALTWGQGIASRGHLRGLSSPAAQRSGKAESRPRPRSQLSSSPKIPISVSSPVQKPEMDIKRTTSSLQLEQKSEEMLSPSMISPSCIMPLHTPDWQLPSPSISENFSHVQKLGQSYEINEPYLFLQSPMQGLQVPRDPRLGSISEYSGSISSGSGISDMDWPSPSDYPHTPDPMPRPVPAFSPMYNTASAFGSSARFSFVDRAPTSCPDLYTSSSTSGGFHSESGVGEASMDFGTVNAMDDLGLCGLSGIMFDDESPNDTTNLSNPDVAYGYVVDSSTSPWPC
jgi:hypothetical protein